MNKESGKESVINRDDHFIPDFVWILASFRCNPGTLPRSAKPIDIPAASTPRDPDM